MLSGLPTSSNHGSAAAAHATVMAGQTSYMTITTTAASLLQTSFQCHYSPATQPWSSVLAAAAQGPRTSSILLGREHSKLHLYSQIYMLVKEFQSTVLTMDQSWMATFFFFSTGILTFLPYTMDHFKNAEHACMKCGRKLATQRFGGSTKAHLM